MVSLRCKLFVQDVLKQLGLNHFIVDLGTVEVLEELDPSQIEDFKTALHSGGLELMDDKKRILIERIQNVIVEMIHHTDILPQVNYSEFISESLDYDYTYLSNTFSEVKGITIQQFIIIHKIERVKELLLYDELSLTEIAFKLHYSSVSHLSNQFKKITGLTPSFYKNLKEKREKNLENL